MDGPVAKSPSGWTLVALTPGVNQAILQNPSQGRVPYPPDPLRISVCSDDRSMKPPLQIGTLLFSGFELLDVFGPLEMLGLLGDRVQLRMLAAQPGEVPSAQGPRAVAECALADASDLDVFLIPGGRGTRRLVEEPAFLEQLRERSRRSRYTASVCTGSALLARAGLLDGRRATTNKRAFDWVQTQGAGVVWVRKARWVEDGCFFTASGVSAGMDMTLGLIGQLFDRSVSLEVACHAEYLWNEDRSDDPFAAA
jgi:putative intracellular protease/amidase